jgi:hypothetical protein
MRSSNPDSQRFIRRIIALIMAVSIMGVLFALFSETLIEMYQRNQSLFQWIIIAAVIFAVGGWLVLPPRYVKRQPIDHNPLERDQDIEEAEPLDLSQDYVVGADGELVGVKRKRGAKE